MTNNEQLLREALAATDAVSALIKHQYTGTRIGMTDLQIASDLCDAVSPKIRAALSQPAEGGEVCNVKSSAGLIRPGKVDAWVANHYTTPPASQEQAQQPKPQPMTESLHWFTVSQNGMPDFDEEVIGGFWYTDPWLKPEYATRFMWGLCRVVKDDHPCFKDGKRWFTFGPSHNDITHWARINTPSHHGITSDKE